MNELKYITDTPISYRKDFGQFFTPSMIACIMSKWIMKDNPKTILDPAFGLGIFYDEIKKIIPNQSISFTSYEIDGHILSYIQKSLDKSDLTIINNDYLKAEMGLFDGIICNPPYMRFQKFLNRHEVLPKIEKIIGKKLVGYTNLASVFLIKAIRELNVNGRLAFIMPFEFFNTGYGEDVRKTLVENFLLKHIIIFANEKEIFPEAITTVCILLCKNDYQEDEIKISLIQNQIDLSNLMDSDNFFQHKILPSKLSYKKKWTPIIFTLFDKKIIPSDFCNISFYGTFTRGIATGANEFFALSKTMIKNLKLDNNICSCITKSSQIKKSVFNDNDFYILSDQDKPVYCLDVKNHDEPKVSDYIKYGEKQEYHKRYLTKNRNPWYKIELRQPSPILFGVFSRGRLKVIRNYSNAINFTCFHSFYPNIFGKRYLNRLFIYLLSDHGQEIIKMNKRSYGDSLDKLEPGDLNDCLCPNEDQFNMIDEQEAQNVIELAKTNEIEAIRISNQLIERIICPKEKITDHSDYNIVSNHLSQQFSTLHLISED
jgi:adenine-specific DNA-methyltransferase